MTIETNRTDLAQTRIVSDESVALPDGDCRLRIDHFALTTNNITYGVFGDMLRYWDVFPPSDPSSGWGRIPTWGVAEVVETRSEFVKVGERFFGFLPMSAETIITPGKSDDRGVSDVAPHRIGLAGAYNRYQRTSTDPVHHPDREHHQMLLYPLFFTSFVIDDFLSDNDDFGATQVIVSSASSKTAIGVAFLAKRRGLKVVGLTSPANQDFVERLDIYSEVLTYENIPSIDQTDSVYVDIAGNQDLLREVHAHLSGYLHHSMVVGNTNWNHRPTSTSELSPPIPEFLFAPAQIAKRTNDWGRDELDRQLGVAWNDYSHWCDGWIEFVEVNGGEDVVAVFELLRDGRPDPRLGYICSLPEEGP